MSDTNKRLEAWMGEFGDEYTERNLPTEKNIEDRKAFWAGILSTFKILPHQKPETFLEIGANVGANLRALESLYVSHNEKMNFYAVEPNKYAKRILETQNIRSLKIANGDALDLQVPTASMDIVMTCGVLIHVHPEDLRKAMSEIYRVSRRFIVCAEYFSPEPREIKYRGCDGLLWARDFGEEWLRNFPGLMCASYSFAWKRFTGMDNLTWWVFEKVN